MTSQNSESNGYVVVHGKKISFDKNKQYVSFLAIEGTHLKITPFDYNSFFEKSRTRNVRATRMAADDARQTLEYILERKDMYCVDSNAEDGLKNTLYLMRMIYSELD